MLLKWRRESNWKIGPHLSFNHREKSRGYLVAVMIRGNGDSDTLPVGKQNANAILQIAWQNVIKLHITDTQHLGSTQGGKG